MSPPTVHVMYRFDTEDYVHRPTDDVTLRMCQVFERHGIKATFIVVGELARTWERERRDDVIEAVGRHDAGYHTNYHSIHPTVPEYCDGQRWEDALAETLRREGSGVRDLVRIFGRLPTCYIQGGASWSPTMIGAMREWGIEVFWEAMPWHSYLSLPDMSPFRLMGVLNFNIPESVGSPITLGGEGALDEAKGKFDAACQRVRARGGGFITPLSHPNNLNTTQSWDLVNYRGINTPRREWAQPQAHTPERIEANFQALEAICAYHASFENVRFIGAGDLPALFPDEAMNAWFEPAAVAALAKKFLDEITFHGNPAGEGYVSASEAAWIVLGLLAEHHHTRGKLAPVRLTRSPLGPPARYRGNPPKNSESLAWEPFSAKCAAVFHWLTERDQLPTRIDLGADLFSPGDFFATAAGAAIALIERGGEPPETVPVRRGNLTLEQYDTTEQMDWGWVFPKGFHPEALCELSRLQAWSFKPAPYKSPD